jgi:3-deoxy-D-manno-octulosonic-acid transferase
LGAPRVVTAGNLKLDVPAPAADSKRLMDLKDAIAMRPMIAAVSTHPGEDGAVIEAHQRLRGNFPGLLTVIAPRHPERGPGVAELAAAAGLKAALRSRGEKLDAATDIYVADTMGELGLIYRLAPVVFIGGSLVKHGGQNPIEAAKLGAAILHGPHVWNFSEIYDALDAAHGAELVAAADRLTATFAALLNDAAARGRATDAARMTVDALGGALERTLESLEPYLMQLQLHGQASHA